MEQELKEHKETATKSREHCNTSKDKCKQQWREITQFSVKGVLCTEEREKQGILQHCFTLTISANYQQSKLIPSWGKTEQPESTYYLQKVSHDFFGIVDHREEKSTVYLFDERIGP